MTPGVSMLEFQGQLFMKIGGLFGNFLYSRLALEIFHNIKESVVHVGLVHELDLDLVQVTECVLFVKHR